MCGPSRFTGSSGSSSDNPERGGYKHGYKPGGPACGVLYAERPEEGRWKAARNVVNKEIKYSKKI